MMVGFAKVSIKGEGDAVGWLDLFTRVTLPPCGFPPTRE